MLGNKIRAKNKMRWIAELYIFTRDYDFQPKEPDAFVECDTQQEAIGIISQYVLTMVNKHEEFRIEIKKKKIKRIINDTRFQFSNTTQERMDSSGYQDRTKR